MASITALRRNTPASQARGAAAASYITPNDLLHLTFEHLTLKKCLKLSHDNTPAVLRDSEFHSVVCTLTHQQTQPLPPAQADCASKQRYRTRSRKSLKSSRSNMTESIYTFTEDFDVTPNVQADFDKNGYILVRSLLDQEEIKLLKDALESDEGLMRHAFCRDDGEGGKSRLVLWNQPGNDITGVMARCEKVAGTMEKLLGGEVYHYHTKLMMKEARTGGAFVWHQDYGYWYENGCIFPDMGTVFIALDQATQENGCLKVIPGSQRVGRIDHVRVGDQVGADVERVTEVRKFLPLAHVEMEPGDALFFHCNLLHRSEQNHSDRRRWAFLVAYNRASNNPVMEHHHPRYTPMAKVPNTAIRECTTATEIAGKDFFDPATEVSLKKVTEKTLAR